MPLLLTTTEDAPLLTTALVPVQQVYAIIQTAFYDREKKAIECTVRYYVSELACDAKAAWLHIQALPPGFTVPMTPEQANEVPVFQVMESVLTQQLRSQFPDLAITDAPAAPLTPEPESPTGPGVPPPNA